MTSVLGLSVGGCAMEPGGVPRGISDVPRDKAGIVFGSIGAAEPAHFAQQGLRYRARGSRDSAAITFDRGGFLGTPVDVAEGTRKLSLFAMRLPPGDYELHNVFFVAGTTTFSSGLDFSVPFKLKEATATYIGEFVAYAVTQSSLFGAAVPGRGYFVVDNKLERDFNLLGKKGFSFARDRVHNETMNPRAFRLPVFQDKRAPHGSTEPRPTAVRALNREKETSDAASLVGRSGSPWSCRLSADLSGTPIDIFCGVQVGRAERLRVHDASEHLSLGIQE